MDRYHSIVGPMVSYHWKPLKNHQVQWLLDYKTIEKPLEPMVARPKTNAKPSVLMVCQTKNHRKTIDTNGCFPTIHSMAMVCMNYENLSNFAMVAITKPIIPVLGEQSYHQHYKNFKFDPGSVKLSAVVIKVSR